MRRWQVIVDAGIGAAAVTVAAMVVASLVMLPIESPIACAIPALTGCISPRLTVSIGACVAVSLALGAVLRKVGVPRPFHVALLTVGSVVPVLATGAIPPMHNTLMASVAPPGSMAIAAMAWTALFLARDRRRRSSSPPPPTQ